MLKLWSTVMDKTRMTWYNKKQKKYSKRLQTNWWYLITYSFGQFVIYVQNIKIKNTVSNNIVNKRIFNMIK
jgi:hypothetical protein